MTDEPSLNLDTVGIGYTLATGRLYCNWVGFTLWAEALLGRQIYTHEYASPETWDELRTVFESNAQEDAG